LSGLSPTGTLIDRKKPSIEAARKASDWKTGWYGPGQRASVKKPKNATSPARSTASSNVIGMFAGGPCGGRLPMLSGQSSTFMK
jgi:hypothetical protein